MIVSLPGFAAFADNGETPIDPAELTRVDILTFADFHGNVDSMMNDNDPGAARFVAYAEWLRQQNPNPENVIVVPGGDDFHGHPLSNYLMGEPVVAMMEQLGVEYMALGNHEFSFGFARTLELAEYVTFLASDLFYADEDIDIDAETHLAYMQGDESGYLRPLARAARADAAAVLVRTQFPDFEYGTLPEGMDEFDVFSDVDEDAWYFYYIAWAYDAGLITGDPPAADGTRTFRPHDDVLRVEFAAMVARTAEEMLSGETEFEDADQIAEWAEDYVYTAYESGWITGDLEGYFRPLNHLLRAEVATVLNRMLGRIDHNDYLDIIENIEDAREFPDVALSAWYFASVIAATNDHLLTRDEYGVIDWMSILDEPAAVASATSGGRPDFVEPYAILEFEDGDITVALIGLMTSGMSHLVADPAMANFEFRTPTIGLQLIDGEVAGTPNEAWVTATEDLIDFVREEYGADAVVAVTHMYRAEAAILANLIEGFDAIIGGHGHGTYTDTVNGTPIIEAGQHGRHMGRISLYFDGSELDEVDLWMSPAPPPLVSGGQLNDPNANVESIRDFNRPAGTTFDGIAFPASQHPDFLVYPSIQEAYDTMAAIIAEFAAEAADYLDEVLGTRSIYSNTRPDRNVWVTRLVLDYVVRSTEEDDWVYVSNFGGWRNVPPFQFGPTTDVLMREMYATMPFNNTILLYEMYGSDLLTLLNMEASSDAGVSPPTFGLNGGQPPVVSGAFRGDRLDSDAEPFMIEGVARPRYQWYLTATGEAISDDDTVYRVVGSNFTQGAAAGLLPGGTPVGGGDRFPIPGTIHGNALGMTFLGMPQALMQDGSLIPWNEVPTDNTLWEVQGLRTLRSAMIAQQRYRGENPGYTAELAVSAVGDGTAVISAPFAPGDQSMNVNVVPQAVTVTATLGTAATFLGWFDVANDTAPLSTDLVYTFVQTGALTLEARFA